MSTPRVAVCIPLYNGAAYLPTLLSSIRQQTFRDFRVLMADDVSTDPTVATVEPFLSDPRFQLLRRDVNLGFNGNLRDLMDRCADADYAVLPGQDDAWSPAFLEKHVRLLDQHPEMAVAHSRSLLMDERGQPLDIHHWYWPKLPHLLEGEQLVESLLTHNYICLPSAVVRMGAFRQVRDDFRSTNYTFVPDWWLWLLLAGRGWSFGYLAEPDCRYRVHAGQLTQTMREEARLIELSCVLAEFARLFDRGEYAAVLPKKRQRSIRHFANARLFRRGVKLLARGSFQTGLALIREAWRNDPVAVAGYPIYFSRYLKAKSQQQPGCSGLIELLHPIGDR